jgi:hypothetical protein
MWCPNVPTLPPSGSGSGSGSQQFIIWILSKRVSTGIVWAGGSYGELYHIYINNSDSKIIFTFVGYDTLAFEFARCLGKLSLRAVDRDRNFENCILNEQNLQENGEEESFEDLQDLFEELFKGDIDTFGSSFQTSTCSGSSSSYTSFCESSSSNNKRNSS